jgi:hypothetical protein
MVFGAALAMGAALFALWLFKLTHGAVPRHNVYFGADTDRVAANLLDPGSDFRRATVHPLYGLICLLFQAAFARATDMGPAFATLAAINGAVFGALTYATGRSFGANVRSAAASVVLGTASGAFIYWAPMPETHFLAGMTALGALLLARAKFRDPIASTLRSAVGFALSFSLVVTNALAWLLGELDLEPRRLWAANSKRLPAIVCSALAGLGLVTIGAAFADYELSNPYAGRLLHVFGETKFISYGPSSPLGGLNALGGMASDASAWAAVDGAFLALLLFACWRNGRKALPLALFPICGVLLHTVYSRTEAFLFSPDYAPAMIAAIAVLATVTWARWGWAPLLASALLIAPLNLGGFQAKLAGVRSDPLPTYGLIRPRIPEVILPAELPGRAPPGPAGSHDG